jgi:hypothetical protein
MKHSLIKLQKEVSWRQYVPPKHWYLPASPHGVAAQKTNIVKKKNRPVEKKVVA